jgi:hypothetical protein
MFEGTTLACGVPGVLIAAVQTNNTTNTTREEQIDQNHSIDYTPPTMCQHTKRQICPIDRKL